MEEKLVKEMFAALDRADAKKRGETHFETKFSNSQLGNLNMKFETEFIDGEGYDTKVTSEGGYICCISLPEKEKFIKDLNKVIDKYRI